MFIKFENEELHTRYPAWKRNTISIILSYMKIAYLEDMCVSCISSRRVRRSLVHFSVLLAEVFVELNLQWAQITVIVL